MSEQWLSSFRLIGHVLTVVQSTNLIKSHVHVHAERIGIGQRWAV